jgi:hypothetical protein
MERPVVKTYTLDQSEPLLFRMVEPATSIPTGLTLPRRFDDGVLIGPMLDQLPGSL